MRYYTIQNNGILIADNEQALTRFYDNVLPLPDDYEDGKYIIVNNELVLNPNWEEEQAEKEKQKMISDIKAQLAEIDLKRIRAVCENEIKDETTQQTWLEYYNRQIKELRQQLETLQ